jgi:hypothetical protein
MAAISPHFMSRMICDFIRPINGAPYGGELEGTRLACDRQILGRYDISWARRDLDD